MSTLTTTFLLHGARAFAATIGPQCLTSDLSAISADGEVVTVSEAPDCASEIKEIAKNWELFATTDAIVTVTGSPEALAAKRSQLESRYGKSPNPRLRFLAATQTCRCLVMAGKLSLEASNLVEGEKKPPQKAAPPLDDRDPIKQHDLIWRESPAPSVPAERPLVN
jgi:hypothetical protein